MKEIACNVIVDLLPLYEDGCCSEETRRLIEEHINTCDSCRKLAGCSWDDMTRADEMIREAEPDEKCMEQSMKRMRKARRLGLRLFVICIAAFFVVLLSYNQIRKEGICFSSIGEVHQVMKFVRMVERGEYEEAYEILDIQGSYEELLEEHSPEIEENIREIEEKGFEWYDNVCKAEFISNMTNLEQQGKQIEKYQFGYAWAIEDEWEIGIRVSFEHGDVVEMVFRANADKLEPQISMQGAGVVDRDVQKSFTMITLNETMAEALYKNTDVFIR